MQQAGGENNNMSQSAYTCPEGCKGRNGGSVARLHPLRRVFRLDILASSVGLITWVPTYRYQVIDLWDSGCRLKVYELGAFLLNTD